MSAMLERDLSNYPPRYWSVSRLAEAWSCSPGKIYQLIRDKKLASVTIDGTMVRIPHEAVEEYERCAKKSSGLVDTKADTSPSVDAGAIASAVLSASRRQQRTKIKRLGRSRS